MVATLAATAQVGPSVPAFAPVGQPATSDLWQGTSLVDADGDGIEDLVYVGWSGAFGPVDAQVHLGLGNGLFGADQTSPLQPQQVSRWRSGT